MHMNFVKEIVVTKGIMSFKYFNPIRSWMLVANNLKFGYRAYGVHSGYFGYRLDRKPSIVTSGFNI